MPTRDGLLDDFLTRLRLTRQHLGGTIASGWTEDHGSLKVQGRPLLGDHVARHLDRLSIDPATFAEAMKDVPDRRLTEDRMTNVVRRQVQHHQTRRWRGAGWDGESRTARDCGRRRAS